MALPVYRTAKAPATYGIPGGQATQNRLYSMLSKNTAAADTNPGDTFVWDPNTVFGTYPGGASTDTGQKAGSNVHNSVLTPGTTQSTTGGSQADAPPATTTNNTTTTTNGNGNGNGNDQSAIDFSGDPILARIRALNAQNIANAEASALAARKQAEIGYGYDPNITYEDQATQDAAKQNTYSTLAQLLSGYQENDRALTEAENKANLFYSGERIRQTGLEGKQYGLQQTQAASTYQGVINQIAQGVLDAKLAAQGQETQGMSDAYTRALQTALANGTGDPNNTNASGSNLKDFDYGATIPAGYSDEAIYQAAVDGAPQGATPMHIMNQGQVQNGMISIKYRMPDGTTNTIWVALPKGSFTRPTNTNPNSNPTPTSTSTTTTSTPSPPPTRAPQ